MLYNVSNITFLYWYLRKANNPAIRKKNFFDKKKTANNIEKKSYDKEHQKPIIRTSICIGEQVV